jgi:hypothetical protein
MKATHTIWRFFSTSWLVAAPMVIIALLIAGMVLLAIVDWIVEHIFGAETADNLLATTMVSLWIAIEFAIVALIIYGLFRLARRLLRKNAP